MTLNRFLKTDFHPLNHLKKVLCVREFPHTIQCRSTLKPFNLSSIERMIQFLLSIVVKSGEIQSPKFFHL